jgi:hypothetical protein
MPFCFCLFQGRHFESVVFNSWNTSMRRILIRLS